MKKGNRYSPWEYDEDEGKPSNPPEGQKDPGQGTEDPDDPGTGGAPVNALSDDTEIDVNGEKVTVGEMKAGYMRQSDYTKKTQEIAREREEFEKSKQPPAPQGEEEYTPEDEKAAEVLFRIGKKKFGLMTREEFEREREAEQFGNKLNSVLGKWNKNPDLPKTTDTELVDFMKENNIHNPDVALREMHQEEWLSQEFKNRSKGKKGYSSEKQGQRIEPKPKTYDFKKDEGMRDFLQDEINKVKE
jgi:hypothetical protein